MFVSVVIPAHNEAATIERTLTALVATMDAAATAGSLDAFEIIVVDDHSADATAVIVERFGSGVDAEVRTVPNDRSQGLGAALRSGFEAARGTHVIYTDADLPFDLAAMSDAYRWLSADPHRAVRAVRSTRRGNGFRRFVYSVAYQALIAGVFGDRFYDVNFAGKAMERERLLSLGLRSDGSFIDAEWMLRAARRGVSFRTVAVEYQPRVAGESSLSSLAVIRHMLQEMRAQRRTIGRVRTSRRASGVGTLDP